MPADPNRRRLVAAHRIARDPETETNRIRRIGHSKHERVADRLDVLAVDLRQRLLNDTRKVFDELNGLLVSVRLRKRREAGDVRKQEGRSGIARHY